MQVMMALRSLSIEELRKRYIPLYCASIWDGLSGCKAAMVIFLTYKLCDQTLSVSKPPPFV
jgi:hypothetical protein